MASDHLEIGNKLENYIIHSVLGRGAFGITYLAHDENLHHFVAIKEYLPQEFAIRDKNNTVQPYSQQTEDIFYYGLKSFLHEARVIVKFSHPNIVNVLSFFRKNGTAYIVMTYEKGKTLKDYVQDKLLLSEKKLLDIILPINKGLSLIHKNNYIHRDIKPANIIIREDNTPVLIDFGAARDITINSDPTKIFTNGYAPFEQCNPSVAKQGPWTDIYSLGATLYFSIRKEPAVPSQFRSKTKDSYEPLLSSAEYHEKYSKNFLKAIDNALAFEPNSRPQNLKSWNKLLRSGIYKKKRWYEQMLTGIDNQNNNSLNKKCKQQQQTITDLKNKCKNQQKTINDLKYQLIKIKKLQQPENQQSDTNLVTSQEDKLNFNNQETSKQILWVDDNPQNNSFLINFLTERGHVVDIALTTNEGLNQFTQKSYDIVISDMGRPEDERAGITLAKKIRAMKSTVPYFIFCGIWASQNLRSEALENGVSNITSHNSTLINSLPLS